MVKDRLPILDGVSCELARGSITGLLGPSGAGKTTLMRVLVGLQRPASGRAAIFDIPAGEARLRDQIGYVTQSPSIYLDLTVLENLTYFAKIIGDGSGQADQLIRELDLVPQRDQLVERLSGGQRARVSLAIALLGHPKLLVLDEPTVGLDPLLRRDLWERFRRLAAQGATLLVSSHVMDEAAHCDRILLLRDGKLLADTTLAELLDETGERSPEAAFIALVEAK